jgi:hypothetical protein
MPKKLLIVAGIVACTIVVILLMTFFMNPINSFIDIAKNDTTLSGDAAGNFTAYSSALDWARLAIYFIPVLVAGLAIFVTLRAPEGR